MIVHGGHGAWQGLASDGTLRRGRGYAQEAVETLVGSMSQAEFKGNIVVVLCSSEEGMATLMQDASPSFRSRFDKIRIRFPAWTAAQAADSLIACVESSGKTLTREAQSRLLICFTQLVRLPGWSSARDVFEVIMPVMLRARGTQQPPTSR